MASQLGLLLRHVSWFPRLREWKSQSLLDWSRNLLFAFFGFCFLGLLFLLFKQVILFCDKQEMIGPALTDKLVQMALLVFFALLCFSNLLSLLSALYLAQDADFLLASPLAPPVYFLFKFLGAAFSSGWMVVVLWGPLLLALQQARHLGFWLLVWGLLAPLPLCFLAACLAGFLLLPAIRFSMALRLKRYFLFSVAIFCCALIFLVRLLQPDQLTRPEAKAEVGQYLALLGKSTPIWLPSTWAAQAVLQFSKEPVQAAGFLLLSCAVAAGLFACLLVFAKRFFLESWLQSKNQTEATRSKKNSSPGLWRFGRGKWTVFYKDVALFKREPSSQVQFLILAFLFLIYFYNLYKLPMEDLDSMRSYLFNLSCVFSAFINNAIAMRFLFPAVSLEREGFSLLKSSPLPAAFYLRGKLLLGLSLLFLLALMEFLFSVHLFKPESGYLLSGAVVLLGTCVGICSLNLGLGAAWADFTAQRPDELITSSKGALLMLASAAFILMQAGLMVFPAREIHRLNLSRRFTPEYAVFVVCGLLLVLVNLAAIYLPLKLGSQALEGD